MGIGRRIFLLIISRMFCLIDKVWSFPSGFVTSGTIRWNASEEFKAIWVFFARSFCRTVAISSSRVLMSLPAKAWPTFSDGYPMSQYSTSEVDGGSAIAALLFQGNIGRIFAAGSQRRVIHLRCMDKEMWHSPFCFP